MKTNSKLLIGVFLAGMIFSACKKDHNNDQPFLGYNYFPLTVGSEKVYQVDSIGWLGYTYDPIKQTVQIDTVKYEVKEVVESIFLDNEGRQTARILRYRRFKNTDPWVIYKVWSANITATTAERYEDNIRYIKLVFPPKKNIKWNGNSLNTNDPWEYQYEAVNTKGYAGSLNFDSTLSVLQMLDDNLVNYRNYIEQYASEVGMIYKEYNDYEYISIGNPKIKNGFIYKETLLSFTP